MEPNVWRQDMGQCETQMQTPPQHWAVFSLPGLCCSTCVEHVDCTLRTLHGVSDCRTDIQTRCIRVDYDEAKCGLADLVTTIQNVGYQVEKVLATGLAESGLAAPL